jgi:hypothetical protein
LQIGSAATGNKNQSMAARGFFMGTSRTAAAAWRSSVGAVRPLGGRAGSFAGAGSGKRWLHATEPAAAAGGKDGKADVFDFDDIFVKNAKWVETKRGEDTRAHAFPCAVRKLAVAFLRPSRREEKGACHDTSILVRGKRGGGLTDPCLLVPAKDPDFFKRLATSQHPQILWIGCADARVPANTICGLDSGDVFVQRNIANMVVGTDTNAMSVIQYAVDFLQVVYCILRRMHLGILCFGM